MWGTETGGERYKDPTGALLGYVRHTASTINLLEKNIKTKCNKTKILKKTEAISIVQVMTKNYLYFVSNIGTVFNTQLKITEIYTIPFKIFFVIERINKIFWAN